MARAIWSGVLSFGLVSVPVELYTATEAHGPLFHQFEEGTADRIRYQRVNERTGDEVEYSDIVKGTDVGGDYVLLDQDELDSVAPGRSRLMDIHTFVDLSEALQSSVQAARKGSGRKAPAKKPGRKKTGSRKSA